ncbi:MAG: hypothetical protein KKA73_14165 [Chloroflexi bacterium]|nr:hypothetical protein [Chloroflexota bacterium]MBU1748830.1 hypothetical protein [Chloroflexota bacterium]
MNPAQAGDWVQVRCTVLQDGRPLREPVSYGPLGRLLPPQFRLVAGAGSSDPALLAEIGQAVVGMSVGETRILNWSGPSAGAGLGEASSVAIELLQITPATLAANRG